eukprot:GAHX01001046.1.p1 GENE.GAHX01001046.1~~GAHX01001046.1.p1  ORF type:complete len:1091 (+),score=225.05 GAHX01001046.1:24-3275(+)
MEISYNYYEVLEKLCNEVNKVIANLQKELLLDTSSSTDRSIDVLLNQKMAYLRHLFLRFYSLNEWITTNYDYYCKANITNHVLDLREKGFKTISEYYFHLTNDLRHRKTPIWAVDMALMNITNTSSELYADQVMKYLVNRNFEVPPPVTIDKKTEFVEKLNGYNLKIEIEDTKFVYTSDSIKVSFDALGDYNNYYISIENMEILNAENTNTEFIISFLNKSIKHINTQSYSLDELKPDVKSSYELIKDESYFKIVICLNFIEKYIFEYKLNSLEDIITNKEHKEETETYKETNKVEFFNSNLTDPQQKLKTKRGTKKTKSFLSIPFLSENKQTNCRLEFDKQNKTKLFFIFWDDYKNKQFSIQTIIVEVYYEDLNLTDNQTIVIKLHGFERIKELYIIDKDILELFKEMLILPLKDEQNVNKCLCKLQINLARYITESIYEEIINIFKTHCGSFLNNIIKVGFNVYIDYNTGSLLLYSLGNNVTLGGILKGEYNTDFIRNIENCTLQNSLHDYIDFVLWNVSTRAYVLYILKLNLHDTSVNYDKNKITILFNDTNVTLNITSNYSTSHFTFNNEQIEYDTKTTRKLTGVVLYKGHKVMSEASFAFIISKLENVYLRILKDRIESVNDVLNEMEINSNIEVNPEDNYALSIHFNKSLFSGEYFKILNKDSKYKFENVNGTTTFNLDIKTVFKENVFEDLKKLILCSIKVENIKNKIIELGIKECEFIAYSNEESFLIKYKDRSIEVNSDLQLKFENLVWDLPEHQLSYCIEAFENAIEYKLSMDKVVQNITKNQRSIYEYCSPFTVLGVNEEDTLLERNVKYVLHDVFDMDIYFYSTKIYTVKIKPFNTEETAYTGASYIRSARHMIWSIPTFYSVKNPVYFFESCKNLLFMRLAYTDYLRTINALKTKPENDICLKFIDDKIVASTKSDRINKLIAYVNKKPSERLILLFFKSLKNKDAFVLLKMMSLEALERACCVLMNVDEKHEKLYSTFKVSLSNKEIIIVEFEYCKTQRKVIRFCLKYTSFESKENLKSEVYHNLKVLIEKANKRFEGGSRKDVIVDNSELAPQILELIMRGLCGQVYN